MTAAVLAWRHKRPLALGLLLALLALGLALVALGDFDIAAWQSATESYRAFARDHMHFALLLTFLLHALLAALALPGAALLMLAAGAAFGAAAGTLLCLAGCTAGATLTMLAARHWLGPPLRRRFGDRLADLDRRIAEDGAAWLFSLRLLPVLPFVLVNVGAGLAPMKTWTFVWVSFLGMAAGTFAYVNAGAELGHMRTLADLHSPQLLASLLLLAALPWIGRRVASRRRVL